ncbi:oxidoreductase [Saccharopolyspora rhizosphaerae]|uniref:Oxidoreductase n=1 Tax=Saccharopolyspora rhizosphaerae TaxID=2492662 RepID=A0A3R8P130_9PSEU|nr:oxidoreductase [Saccharopolyspora rhizosphaerae]RRO17215.1 oxidoreductase [Saccharopolyspora rhizosphaerae]
MNDTPSLAPLLELDGVADAVAAARAAIDEVHRHPANRRGWPTTAAEASVRAARASAAVAGGATEIPESGEVSDPLLAGSLRVAEAMGTLLPTWQRAPRQALARMHLLAASDLVDDPEQLGRPQADPVISERLDLLSEIVIEPKAHGAGPVLAAVVHGELLALTPFGQADGVIARAAARLAVIGSGLDPKGLVVPEVAYFRRQEDYTERALGFATGEPDAVAAWVVHCCSALEAGAREAASIADAVQEG